MKCNTLFIKKINVVENTIKYYNLLIIKKIIQQFSDIQLNEYVFINAISLCNICKLCANNQSLEVVAVKMLAYKYALKNSKICI